MRALFITCSDFSDNIYGGVKASKRNYTVLREYVDVDIYTIKKKSNFKSAISLIHGYYPPINNEDYCNISKMLEITKYDFVFYDGSYFGRLLKKIKKTVNKSIVFYHNCEKDYVQVRFGEKNSLKKILYKLSVIENERIATNYADYRIVLSERDRNRIKSLYSITPESILPLTLIDQYQKKEKIRKEKNCLLFGPTGNANEKAFSWFVREVSPYLNCKTVIAGKGFEKYTKLWNTDKVYVVGTVDDIAQLYADATCVAIPLLSGAGMKIKTAEAMMFGKYIFGTDEAFSGFSVDYEGIGGLCNSAEEFVWSINEFLKKNSNDFNEYARRKYKKMYSIESSVKRFSLMLNEFLNR